MGINSAETERGNYTLLSEPKYKGFQKVEVTEVDQSKPWKPPVKVKVTTADGREEEIAASTPFHTFEGNEGKKLTVSAATAGHVDNLHIKGTEPGSHFDFPSLEALLADVADKLPAGITDTPGPSAFDMDMGKKMGTEGLATMQELLTDGVITQSDIDAAQRYREEVTQLNKIGDQGARQAFVAKFASENPDCKIQFQVIRGGAVLVPTVKAPKRPTNKLFMVFGPTDPAQKDVKTMWTTAPGRYMPRHPVPTQFSEAEGGPEGDAYKEAATAWFNTVMLVG
ncbi:MAG: hypothetical protein WC604_02485 [Candidatus Gracilibacteria bacterium]